MAIRRKTKLLFVCEACGEEYLQWQGRCGQCGNWNTLKEFRVPLASGQSSLSNASNPAEDQQPVQLSTISGGKNQRLASGLLEVDQVLGGGIVAGSVILLGGDPGIGKSTLLLQVVEKMAGSLARSLLYVSGEESPEQIKIRAERLGIVSPHIQLLSATNVERVTQIIERDLPAMVVIDSIQTMYHPEFPSTPGSIVQVRECALLLQQLAKRSGVPLILVGHITKDGTVAGPRLLEHLVDVVLYLEGETGQSLRILRAVKNRFGDISQTGIFSMEEQGMVEVSNPSRFLLTERVKAPGSVLSAVMEGNRPILIEVQALTTPSLFGYPRRTASGFDLNRLNLLLAVLQKRAGINLSTQDVFVNIVGGLKIKDPAIDAAVCLALISAFKEVALPEKMCVIGEVGLVGELRRVSGEERRLKEIKGLGYEVPPGQKSLSALIASLITAEPWR